MNFWRLIWTPPVVGKEKNADEIKSNWMHCFRIAIERLADLMFDELRSPDMNHVSFNSLCPLKMKIVFNLEKKDISEISRKEKC
jgi:hypothetical protein